MLENALVTPDLTSVEPVRVVGIGASAGGIVLVQSITSAGFDGMPRAAIATGCVDAVLDPESMPEVIERFVADPSAVSDGNSDATGTENQRLLELLLRRFGVDFGEFVVPEIVAGLAVDETARI